MAQGHEHDDLIGSALQTRTDKVRSESQRKGRIEQSTRESAGQLVEETNSMSRPPDGINILDGKFYLKDAGYACCSEILPPFSYLLYELSTRNHHKSAKELFNLTHSSLRDTVERAFVAGE
jgi:hypothetical protein